MEDLVSLVLGFAVFALGFVLGDRHRARRPSVASPPVSGPAAGIGALMEQGLAARQRGDSAEAARCFHASADLVADLLEQMLDEKLAQTRH